MNSSKAHNRRKIGRQAAASQLSPEAGLSTYDAFLDTGLPDPFKQTVRDAVCVSQSSTHMQVLYGVDEEIMQTMALKKITHSEKESTLSDGLCSVHFLS